MKVRGKVDTGDRLLTAGEVASLFRVDPKTISKWAAAGRIQSIRTPGGHRKFRESEVRALLESGPLAEIEAVPSLTSSSARSDGISETHAYVPPDPSATWNLTPDQQGAGTGDLRPDGPIHAGSVRQISLNAYLATEDERVAGSVFAALDNLAAVMGYGEVHEIEIKRGSFWRRANAWSKKILSSEELNSRLVKVERAVEIAYLDEQQADVNAKESASVTQLIQSLESVPEACLQVGSLLILKRTSANGAASVVARRLSQMEVRALERYPEIQGNPAKVLDALATVVDVDSGTENDPPQAISA